MVPGNLATWPHYHEQSISKVEGFFFTMDPRLRNLLLRLSLRPQPRILLFQLGRNFSPEVFQLENLAEFDLGSTIERSPLQPLDGFLHRTYLPQPEARDQLLGFGEWSVNHGPLAS